MATPKTVSTSELKAVTAADEDTQVAEPGRSSRSSRPRTRHGSLVDQGERIGRYVIIDLVGMGGMGAVYAAYDPELDRRVALKVIHAPDEEVSRRRQQRLLREAQAMARVSHPEVITVHDVGTDRGRVFLAMEFLDGGTLKQWLRGRVRPWQEVLLVFVAAGRGLAAAHRAGLVHRDFKPDNVMLEAAPGDAGLPGRIKVTDFGLARADAEGSSYSDAFTRPSAEAQPPAVSMLDATLTRDGAVLGTPAYVAPEVRQHRRADARSDQYSFCVALWEGIFGVRPFEDDPLLGLPGREPRLRAIPPGRSCPGWLRRALLRGLSIEPDDRHRNMEELLRALERGKSRRRRLAMVAGAGALVAVVSAAFLPDRQCAQADASLQELWNPARQRALSTAFEASDKTFALETAARVEVAVQRQVAALGEQMRSACRATRVEHTQSEALFDRRMACVRERELELHAVLSLLEKGGDRAIAEAPLMMVGLRSPQDCAHSDALLDAPALPSDPVTREAIEELQVEIANVDALRRVDPPAAVEQARQTVARAEAVGWQPLVATALERLTYALLANDEGEEAEQAALRTLRVATDVGDDFLIGRAAAGLIHAVGVVQKRPEAASWAPLAEAHVARAGAPPKLEGWLWETVGQTEFIAGRYDEARTHLQRALQIQERGFGPDHVNAAFALERLGMVEYAVGRLDESRAHLVRARALFEAELGSAHPAVANVTNLLGNVELQQERFDEALSLYELAARRLTDAYGPNHPKVARVVVNQGNALQTLGRTDEAIARFENALAILIESKGADSPDVAMARLNLGASLVDAGRPEQSLVQLEQAQASLTTRFGEEYPGLDLVTANVAAARLAQGHFEIVLEEIEPVLKRWNETAPSDRNLALALELRADALLSLGRIREAGDATAAWLEVVGRLDDAGLPGWGAAYLARAVALLRSGDPGAAAAVLDRLGAPLEPPAEGVALHAQVALIRVLLPQDEARERMRDQRDSEKATTFLKEEAPESLERLQRWLGARATTPAEPGSQPQTSG